MESSVDLPHPEGPAIETYSPALISRWMPDRAWVSTSSVRKTLVTPFMRSSVGVSTLKVLISFVLITEATPLRFPLNFESLQPNAVHAVLSRHIGEDDLVAFLQPLQDLDRVNRRAPYSDARTYRFVTRRLIFK